MLFAPRYRRRRGELHAAHEFWYRPVVTCQKACSLTYRAIWLGVEDAMFTWHSNGSKIRLSELVRRILRDLLETSWEHQQLPQLTSTTNRKILPGNSHITDLGAITDLAQETGQLGIFHWSRLPTATLLFRLVCWYDNIFDPILIKLFSHVGCFFFYIITSIYPEICHDFLRFSTHWTTEKDERNLYFYFILGHGILLNLRYHGMRHLPITEEKNLWKKKKELFMTDSEKPFPNSKTHNITSFIS